MTGSGRLLESIRCDINYWLRCIYTYLEKYEITEPFSFDGKKEKGRKGKRKRKSSFHILCRYLKHIEVTFYFYFYFSFFFALRKEIFHWRIKYVRGRWLVRM